MDQNLEESNEGSMIGFIIELSVYVIIFIIVVMIFPSFFIYPGIYYGRWKTKGPVFELDTKDGAKIEGMIFDPKDPSTCKTTILFFHGNSGNMGSSFNILNGLKENHNAFIISIDYRGFGNCSGFPSESGLINDAESIFERILNDERMKKTKKIVYGVSLGGAVAISLAEKNKKVDALILENTFTCIKDVASKMRFVDKIPEFILDLGLSANSWNSVSRIKDLKIPILFISGLKDNIVSPSLMKKLYETSTSENKIKIDIVDGGHNNTHSVESEVYHDNLKKLINLL